MKSKSLITNILFIVFFLFSYPMIATDCECGSTGEGETISWTVGGESCCNSQAEGDAYAVEWGQQGSGTYYITYIDKLSGSDAQGLCCRPS